MKKLRELQGGYPRQQDYLLSLQTELMLIADSLFAKLGHDMVLRGCEVVDNGNGTINIAAGIVYVGGEVMRFDGVSNIISDGSKALAKGAAANTTPKLFSDGQSREVYTEAKAEVVDASSPTQIKLQPVLYTLATYIEDVVNSYAIKGEIKDIYDFDGTFLTNFDATGLGITPRYNNWALFNGDNGTPNAQGRTRITVGTFTDPTSGEQTIFAHGDLVGEVKHKLIINEMPEHDHNTSFPETGRPSSSNSGNVMAFTNSGNQGARGFNTNKKGGSQAHNNVQPSIAVYTIIKIA